MDEKLLALYGLCADVLNAIGHTEDPQQQMSDAEVITTGLVAMLFFRGNFEAARALLSTPRSMPHMLSRSRLNRRLSARFAAHFSLHRPSPAGRDKL